MSGLTPLQAVMPLLVALSGVGLQLVAVGAADKGRPWAFPLLAFGVFLSLWGLTLMASVVPS